MSEPRWSDRAIVDWLEEHPENVPHVGADGKTWFITAHGNRECWGQGRTIRDCMAQMFNGTGPEKPDR